MALRTAPHRTDQQTDEQLVARAAAGDDVALAELLDRFKPQVRAKARTYFVAGGDRQDVIQEGMIGLYKAVRDYDIERHPSFRHFAELCVTRQIITAVKAATRHKHSPLNAYVSLQGAAGPDESIDNDHMVELADDGTDPLNAITSAADMAQLRAFCLEVLSSLETEVLVRYVSGESYATIAAELGRHTKAIDNAVQRVKRKLEGYLAEREHAA